MRSTCPFCAAGCGLVLESDGARIHAVRPDTDHPVSRGQLCVKGWNAHRALGHPDRLTTPLVRRGDRLVPASWAEALEAVVEAVRSAQAAAGADGIGVISSARATNEDNYAAMRFARGVLGTNNVDHCARVCHAPSVVGLRRTLGSGAMTNSIADLATADCLLVWGSDTTENHPIIGARLLEAKARGAMLIAVDPRRTRLAEFADLHLQLRLGTDIPLANAMLHTIFAHGWEAADYLAARCENADAVRAAVAGVSLADAARTTGVAASDIVAAARAYATTPRAALIYCLGVTQHVCGTENVIALSNLALATGHVGVPGAGINPLRGQNNVQGACDMGALPDVLSGYQPVSDPAVRARFAAAWRSGALPDRPGLTSLAMQHAARDGRLRCLFVLGEDPVVTDPSQHDVARAFDALDDLVVVELFLTETAKRASLVLPAAAWGEKEGTFTSTERRVQRVRRAVAPPGAARADWEILDAIAQRLGRPMGWTSARDVFDEMARLTPIYAGMSYERLERGGLQWPCPNPEHPGTPVLYVERCTRGRGRLVPVGDTLPAELPDDAYPLQLTTFRLHHQYGCGSMTRRVPLLERENPPGLLWINPLDAGARRIAPGAPVRVRSRRGEVTTRAMVSTTVPPGVVAMPYHFAEAPSNRVTNDAVDPISRMPELKVCAVAVEPC
ncbi:MAG TPA: formate dehydrogenase subunit alpha [Candidatus Limnocylindria bacterium]|nr:formate dehydrogenase subunit alpha [Candidatus Limnocylindria bacterium]